MGTGGVVLSLSDLFTQVAHNPVLGLTCLLVLAVVLVNGWTDAPNAIATVVSTGVLSFRRAVALAAACNLLGVLVMTAINATVAETVYSIADFGRTGPRLSPLSARRCAPLSFGPSWPGASGCPPVRAMPWWPGSPGPPWPCPAGWTTSGLEPGDGYSWDWSSPWRWAGGWAACAAVCWSACTPPSPSAAGANWPGRALWPSSTGPRTGRNFWASFSWAPRWPRGAVWAKPSPCPAGLCCSVPPSWPWVPRWAGGGSSKPWVGTW